MRRTNEKRLIVARDTISAPADIVFGVLADLDAHRALTDRAIEIVQLHGPRGRRTGGIVELRGPAGIRRRAHTHVQGAECGRLWGRATMINGTEAELEWLLRPADAGTSVEVRMRLRPRAWSDRLLLRLGATCWLRSRLSASLARLEPLTTTGV